MSWYLFTVYVHIMATVFLVGYTLFWTIIIGSLAQKYNTVETQQFLGLVTKALWPPKGLPSPYRVRFPGLGWIAFGLLVVTGGVLLQFRGLALSSLLMPKLILVAALFVCQFFLSMRPIPAIIRLHMGIVLGVVVLSALLIR